MTNSAASTETIVVERDVWTPGHEWRAAIEHIAGRFARATPLDAEAVLAEPTFAGQVERLASWGDDASVDLDRELGRWFDEHLSMHVRPDVTVTRRIRARATEGELVAVSALPPRAAESILRHAGVWRSIARLEAR